MGDMSHPGHVKILEKWLKSYRAEELFDAAGRILPELAALAPTGERRMSANPHANGGLVLRDLRLPDFRDYLPPDANTLLSVTDHCLRSRDYGSVIGIGKQSASQWLDIDAAVKHCTAGLGIWPWASSDQGGETDVVMACCGDVPTLEILTAVE